MTKSILPLVAATLLVAAAAAEARPAVHGLGAGRSDIIIRIDMPPHDEQGRPLN